MARLQEQQKAKAKFYEVELSEGKKLKKVDMVVAEVDIINRNGRYYSRAAYEAANKRAQSEMQEGKLTGLLDHPDMWYDPAKGSYEDVILKYESITIQGNEVIATAVLVETAASQDFKALYDAGVYLGISTNAESSIKYLQAKEVDPNYPYPDAMVAVVQDDLHYLTIDVVTDPSNSAGRVSYMENTLKGVKTMTLAEMKAKFPELYASVMEEAKTSITPTVPSASVDKAVEDALAKATAELQEAKKVNKDMNVKLLVIEALQEAKLPTLEKQGDIDLNARFEARLTLIASTAPNSEEAKKLVKEEIEERKLFLGAVSKPQGTGVRQGNVESMNFQIDSKKDNKQENSDSSEIDDIVNSWN
jgi:Prohead core protein serine protease